MRTINYSMIQTGGVMRVLDKCKLKTHHPGSASQRSNNLYYFVVVRNYTINM